MSIYERMNQIESKLTALESRFGGAPAPGSRAWPGRSSSAEGAGAISFDRLVQTLSQDQRFQAAPRARGPRPDPSTFDPMIREASTRWKVDESLIRAVIRQESAFDPEATSHCGAQGLMQLMPETAAGLGVRDAYDPRENIMGGTRYLRSLLDRFGGDLTKTLAGYNAGPGAVEAHGGVPPYDETRRYVAKVLDFYHDEKSGRLPH